MTSMAGRTVLITGGTGGIGRATALGLAAMGANVAITGRDGARAKDVAREIRAATGTQVDTFVADLSSQSDVRRLAAETLDRLPRIDVLVNNVGGYWNTRHVTSDGLERTFAVNHLAPFLLTNLLLEHLRASSPARVVTTSSGAHFSAVLDIEDLNAERRWSAWSAYCNSKLANVLFTRALARRLGDSEVTANCLHPGVIRTRLGRGAPLPVRIGWRVAGLFFTNPRKGSETMVYLASAPEVATVTGGYFVHSRQRNPSAQAQDDVLGEELWERSERLTGLG
jgi:retinol dehydrogenase 14